MLRALMIMIACLAARPIAACETALVLAVDVSGSISLDEYALQIEGLAAALEDRQIVKTLIRGQDRIALVQWSGQRLQRLAMGWQSVETAEQASALAATVRAIKRPQLRTVTAIGEAIRFSLTQFESAGDCARHVIDISGDGAENEGMTLPDARSEAMLAGVTLNAIAIEIDAETFELTNYFRHSVITPGGFVITARGLPDYPRAIRDKLERELTKPAS